MKTRIVLTLIAVFLALVLIYLTSVYAIQSHTQATVKVLLKGDVNGDCKVDIFDLATVGLCYGCVLGQTCWQSCSVADVKQDGRIDIFDLATVGLNYGREC